jgi:hypothetical protein
MIVGGTPMRWGLVSRMGKNSMHHFIIEAHSEEDKESLCKSLILGAINNRP